MKITLQTVADRAGVSRAAVSLALRNDPQISAARREEIRRVADELGYRPNPLVSSLMSHLSQTREPPRRAGLLYLVSGENPNPGPWPGHIYDIYFRGAEAQAASRGFRLESFWVRKRGLTEKFCRSSTTSTCSIIGQPATSRNASTSRDGSCHR